MATKASSVARSLNEVKQRRPRLALGWVTVGGRPSAVNLCRHRADKDVK